MRNIKLKPNLSAIGRSLCPECGKVSYSRGGIHPQCSVTRADTVLRAARKAQQNAELKRLEALGLNVPDHTLTKLVLSKLANRGIRTPFQVIVKTKRGAVTLSGTVQFAHQKGAAVRVATGITGVRRVVDHLTVTPPVERS